MPLTRLPNAVAFETVILPTADAGVSITFSGTVRSYSFQCRTDNVCKVGSAQADVEAGGTDFATIKVGAAVGASGVKLRNPTFWFSGDTNGLVIECIIHR